MELTQFLDKLASKEPTPGGGGAAALAGALGIALGNMTGSLTVGKPKYAAVEKALKGASQVPFEIVCKCCEALEIIEIYAKKGSVLAISDVGCASAICKAALESAALNVYVNTKVMKDRAFAENMNKEVDAMVEKYSALASEIYEFVLGGLC